MVANDWTERPMKKPNCECKECWERYEASKKAVCKTCGGHNTLSFKGVAACFDCANRKSE